MLAPILTFYELNDVLLNRRKISRYLGEYKLIDTDIESQPRLSFIGIALIIRCEECGHELVEDEAGYLVKGKSYCEDCYKAVKKQLRKKPHNLKADKNKKDIQ